LFISIFDLLEMVIELLNCFGFFFLRSNLVEDGSKLDAILADTALIEGL
jgi:hypothetical protein